MPKTQKGKELERMFKNQETPEESNRKMNKGVQQVDTRITNEPEFVAKSFEDIYNKLLKYIRTWNSGTKNATIIKLIKSNRFMQFIDRPLPHCKRRSIIYQIQYREDIRDIWYTAGRFAVCPCCGHVVSV